MNQNVRDRVEVQDCHDGDDDDDRLHLASGVARELKARHLATYDAHAVVYAEAEQHDGGVDDGVEARPRDDAGREDLEDDPADPGLTLQVTDGDHLERRRRQKPHDERERPGENQKEDQLPADLVLPVSKRMTDGEILNTAESEHRQLAYETERRGRKQRGGRIYEESTHAGDVDHRHLSTKQYQEIVGQPQGGATQYVDGGHVKKYESNIAGG